MNADTGSTQRQTDENNISTIDHRLPWQLLSLIGERTLRPARQRMV
jgi:hypothetical protein